MNTLLKSNDRGFADHGWLQSHHSFSFANYYNPEQLGFSDLLVINDDHVAPGKGFKRHPHQNMEIFSYVLEGTLEHQDSMGNGSQIQAGDVQLMSAGTGVTHSEFNASPQAEVHFLQIWILPDTQGLQPSYQQKRFSTEGKRGRLQLILSPDGAQGSLRIHQEARVYAGLFDGTERTSVPVPAQRYLYVHLARGSLTVNGQSLQAGDGLRIRQAEYLELAGGNQAEVLVFELRSQELPHRI